MAPITVAVHRPAAPDRWVELTMNLRPVADGEAFVAYAPGFRCEIAPADAEAAGYDDEVWKAGVVSGLGFAWRRWLRPDRGVAVAAVRGHLGFGDVEGVAVAAATAARVLLGLSAAEAASDWAQTIPLPV